MTPCANLALADGRRWRVEGEGIWANQLVASLAWIMRLPVGDGQGRTLRLRSDDRTPGSDSRAVSPFPRVVWPDDPTQPVECLADAQSGAQALAVLMTLASIFVQDAQGRGGVLLHGALAAREGRGVVLVGPSGMGKSTAARRLPPPWQARCDDTTLVVRDGRGQYWAHPWPTWSQFAFNGPGGSWDVTVASHLDAICCLSQAECDRVEAVGKGGAVHLLVNAAEVNGQMPTAPTLPQDQARQARLQRFDNLCQLARAVPVYLLHISRDGAFWREIEQVVLGGGLPRRSAESSESPAARDVAPRCFPKPDAP